MLNQLNVVPPDPIFGLFESYRSDPSPDKINLGLGVIVNEAGQPFVLKTIKQASQKITMNNNGYLPIKGDRSFLDQTEELLFGSAELVSQATCGGTHACSMFEQLMKKSGIRNLLLPVLTWDNHQNIFSDLKIKIFNHLGDNDQVDFNAYKREIEQVREPTVLVLHGGGAHNPTGKNLTREQLSSLIPVLKKRPIFVLFDSAYLGLSKGLNEDCMMLRDCLNNLDNVAVAVSYSKNATLYRHRAGALFIKTKNAKVVSTNLDCLIRKTITNAPAYGQVIMKIVLSEHRAQWLSELEELRQSIQMRRQALVKKIPQLDYLNSCQGLFGLLKLNPIQIKTLADQFSIYIPQNGRINFSGINLNQIDYLVDSLESVM